MFTRLISGLKNRFLLKSAGLILATSLLAGCLGPDAETEQAIASIKKMTEEVKERADYLENLIYHNVKISTGDTVTLFRHGDKSMTSKEAEDGWDSLKEASGLHDMMVTYYRNCRTEMDGVIGHCRLYSVKMSESYASTKTHLLDTVTDLISVSKAIGEWGNGDKLTPSMGGLAWKQLQKVSPAHQVLVGYYSNCRTQGNGNNDSISGCRLYALELAELHGLPEKELSKAMQDMVELSDEMASI